MNWLTKHTPVLAIAAILGFQLFAPPPIGLASNGDFAKVIGVFNLGASPDNEYAYIDLTYRFEPRYRWTPGFYSSETALAAAAIGLNHIFSKDGTFDLRWMGLIHGSLFVLAVYLLQGLLAHAGGWRRFLLWIAVIVFFGDVMYVSYLNSFYMDAAAYVFMLLAVVLFLRAAAWRRKADSVALVMCVVLLLLSKSQHAILGVFLAPLFAFFGGSLWPLKGRWFAIVSTAAVAGATMISVKASPFDYAAHGYYSVIFTQILPHSANVEADLKALGLDDSYKNLVGTHAYSAESGMNDPAFVRRFMDRTSYYRLCVFFLTHPRDTYLALKTSLGEGGRQRPPMGNFDRSVGLPPWSESQAFQFWSNVKRTFFHGRGVRYLNCFVLMAVLVCAIAAARRRTLPGVLIAGVFVIAGMSITEMLTAALADAVEVTRHYFIAATILDLEVLILFALLTGMNLNHRLHPKSAK